MKKFKPEEESSIANDVSSPEVTKLGNFPFSVNTDCIITDKAVIQDDRLKEIENSAINAEIRFAEEEIARLLENSRQRTWELGNIEARIHLLRDSIKPTLSAISVLEGDRESHFYQVKESDRLHGEASKRLESLISSRSSSR